MPDRYTKETAFEVQGCSRHLLRLLFILFAAWIAVLTGLLTSLVLSTLPECIAALVIPETVPVKVGLARDALAAKAFVIAVP